MNKKIDEILTKAHQLHASDIHLSIGVSPVFRINGDLQQFGDVLTPENTTEMANSMMNKTQWALFNEKGEIDFSYGIPGLSRFRINAYFQRSCISLAIRIVPTEIPSIETLGLPDVLKKISLKPQGLVLVTGPTGSGKSTTLAAMINHINKTTKKHIITLEDPIEYLHKHGHSIIDQREIGFDTQNFSNGLRAALRQDPDIILVGEMRDFETISTAITAAETGHLVFGTLHTQDAPSTIDRMIDVFPPSQQAQIRIQLATVLVSVITQRLFPVIEHNRRVVATEILINNPAVANLIRGEKIYQIRNVMQTSRTLGMHTLQMSVKELLKQGLVDREVVLPYLEETGYHGAV